MDVFEDLGPDSSMQVSFHEVKDEIDVFVVFGLDDVEQPDYVAVAVKLLEVHDLHIMMVFHKCTSLNVR